MSYVPNHDNPADGDGISPKLVWELVLTRAEVGPRKARVVT